MSSNPTRDTMLHIQGKLSDFKTMLEQKNKILSQDIILDPKECNICFVDISKNEHAPVSLACAHSDIFHLDCILKWTENKKECPKCRELIDDEVVNKMKEKKDSK